MSDQLLSQFLQSGTTAARTAFTPDPPSPAGGERLTYLWFDEDLQALYAWDDNASAWVVSGTGSTPGLHAASHENGGGDEIDLTGLGGVPLAAKYYPITFTVQLDEPIATGVKDYEARIPLGHAGNIVVGYLRSVQSCNMTVDILLNGSSITDGNPLTLSGGTSSTDSDLSNWDSVAVVAGDVVTIEVLTNDNSEHLDVQLTVERV